MGRTSLECNIDGACVAPVRFSSNRMTVEEYCERPVAGNGLYCSEHQPRKPAIPTERTAREAVAFLRDSAEEEGVALSLLKVTLDYIFHGFEVLAKDKAQARKNIEAAEKKLESLRHNPRIHPHKVARAEEALEWLKIFANEEP